MNHRSRRRASSRSPRPLTATLGELAGPLPPTAVVKAKISSVPRRRHRRGPSSIITKIAEDAVRGGVGHDSIVSVPPVDGTDPLLLFLRRDGQTQLMIGVPPDVVRSRRLRRPKARDRRSEREWELMRVAEVCDPYDDTL